MDNISDILKKATRTLEMTNKKLDYLSNAVRELTRSIINYTNVYKIVNGLEDDRDDHEQIF